jgi:ATP adenylyltransferase
MDRLWSPWRSKYIESFNEQKEEPDDFCLFCDALNTPDKDEAKFVLYRGKLCYVIMNLYPYNSGHLMVVPHRHLSMLTEMTDEEYLEIMQLLKKCSEALNEVMNPHGFNIGTNIGRVSGAGIDHHIHFHIVPRWNGDTNFMPVLGDTKVISEEMPKTYQKLKKHLTNPAPQD